MIPLFVYQGAVRGEQSGENTSYYGVDWVVNFNGSLIAEFPQVEAMQLLLNFAAIQFGTATSPEQQSEVEIFTLELEKQKRIIYLNQLINCYNNELNNLPPEQENRAEEIRQLHIVYQAELAQLLEN